MTLVGHQTLCLSLKPQFCLLHHHENTLLVNDHKKITEAYDNDNDKVSILHNHN